MAEEFPPLYYSTSFKCKNLVPQSNPTPTLAKLFKMERCITYAEMHKDTVFSKISSKLEKDCTSEPPNAFWKREKYSLYNLTLSKNQKPKKPLLPSCLPQKENSMQAKLKNY